MNTGPQVSLRRDGTECRVCVGGSWDISQPWPPEAGDALRAADGGCGRLLLTADDLRQWDSSLLVFLVRLVRLARAKQVEVVDNLPPGLGRLLQLAFAVPPKAGAQRSTREAGLLERLGGSVLSVPVSVGDFLEFLGDAVLNAVIADMLYREFRRGREGFLTNTRSKIVQRETLNRIADESGLAGHVKFSRPAHVHNCFMGGNALEAVIGAVYLDRGYGCCRRFIEQKIVKSYIDIYSLSKKVINFKSKLLEWCQKNRLDLTYALISTSYDSDGCTVFHSSVAVGGIDAGKGKGYTKKRVAAGSRPRSVVAHWQFGGVP